MNKHTVAVMGLGVRGKIHIHGLLGNPDDFEITGICDIKQEALDLVAEEYHLQHVPQFLDVEEMLKTVRPEVFVFVTYPDMRLNMIELAIRYGVKAVSFEKPMAESLPEAKRMVDLCHEHGIKAIVCHQQKYLTQFQRMKEKVDSGVIGRITKIHVETQAWFSQLGTHYIDYALWISGGRRAKWVCGHAHGTNALSDTHPSPDYLLGTLELENGGNFPEEKPETDEEVQERNGIKVYVECGYLSEAHSIERYASSDNRLTVYGENGYMYAETDGFWGECSPETGGKLVKGKDAGWRYHQQVPIQTPYYTQFAQWLEDDAKVHPCDIDTAYHGYEILEGMCISALDNVRVDLPIQNLNYPPVLERMEKELPECGSRQIPIYTGQVPRKERD